MVNSRVSLFFFHSLASCLRRIRVVICSLQFECVFVCVHVCVVCRKNENNMHWYLWIFLRDGDEWSSRQGDWLLRDTNRVAQDHVYECSHCLGEHVFHKFGGLTFWKVFFSGSRHFSHITLQFYCVIQDGETTLTQNSKCASRRTHFTNAVQNAT